MHAASDFRCHQHRLRLVAPGFTLLELVVVLAIMAMLVAVVPPMVSGVGGTVDLRGAARELGTALRYTRGRAIAGNREIALELDVKDRYYRFSDSDQRHSLPQRLDYNLYAARSEFSDADTGSIRFFPDGSSTGGRITITWGERAYEVDVNWLVGKITIHEKASGEA